MTLALTAARFDDGTDLLDLLDPSTTGVGVTRISFGPASARSVVESRTDISGARDTSSLHGGRAVSLSFESTSSTPGTANDLISPWLDPSARFWLYFTPAGEAERRILLRADSGTGFGFVNNRLSAIDSSYSWVAPDGILEAATASSVTADATPDVEAGRSYDRTYDRSYPPGPTTGVVTASVDGTTDAWPIITLTGPCTSPNIENQTTNKRLLFPNLSLGPADELVIDMRERTVSLGSQSRLSELDFANSEWWSLVPGDNSIRYYPTIDGGGASSTVAWRHAYL